MSEPRASAPLATPRLMLCASAVVALALLLPRPINFSPLGAFGLWVGAYGRGGRAWLYPLGVLAFYVAFVGGYSPVVMAMVFLGFAGPAVVGSRWLRGQASAARIGVGAVVSSAWFFLVSNLGTWLVFGLPAGQTLGYHYMLGLPFLRNTFAGDLVFSVVLFGGYALVEGMSRRGGTRVAAVR